MSDAKATTTEVEQDEIAETTKLTWQGITTEFVKNLKSEGKGDQERNFKTAFKIFLEATGIAESSNVGMELTEEFEAKINVYIKFQIDRGLSKSTYGPRISKIKSLKNFVDKNFASKLHLQALPNTFGQRLRKLITVLGFTIMGFWRTLPEGLISYKKLRRWSNELQLPSVRSLRLIGIIETHLHVPLGTLRPPQYLQRGHNLKIGQSDSGNKTRAAVSKPYGVWTDSLNKEFQALYRHKTLVILPEGEERSDEGEWTSNESGRVCTAHVAKDILRSFMGYCALPQDGLDPYLIGAGIKLEDLSMALLADKKLIEDFLEFKKLRSGLRVRPVDKSAATSLPAHKISANGLWEYYDKGGRYNQGTILVLSFVSSLLRPGTGHLYQHPEYAERIGSRMIAPTWEDQCRETRGRVEILRKRFLKIQKNGDRKKFDFGRDPKELIQWILDLPRPLFILQEMIKDMADDLLPGSASELKRAIQYRNLILVALLCANPLRITMFSYMKFDENLIRRSDGSWWLQFDKSAFKNRRSLDSNYLVRVAEELWPMLDRYKEEFHPILVGQTGSKFVFVVTGSGRHKKMCVGRPMIGKSLSDVIRMMTELYLPGSIGFRAHAFRHLIATDIIKKDPRLGFFIASRALHDKLETVEKEYVHLKTSEYFEPVNAHFSEAWSFVIGSSRGT